MNMKIRKWGVKLSSIAIVLLGVSLMITAHRIMGQGNREFGLSILRDVGMVGVFVILRMRFLALNKGEESFAE